MAFANLHIYDDNYKLKIQIVFCDHEKHRVRH